jgi:hypothetical protein
MKTKRLMLMALACVANACLSSSEDGPAGAGGSGGAVGLAGHGGDPAGGGGSAAGSGGGGGQATSTGAAGASTSGAAGATAAGGTGGSGGAAGGAGGMPAAGGAAGGTAGAGGQAAPVAQALEGLRVDDPCAGTADTSDGAVCTHVKLTSSGGFQAAKEVTVGGTAGTTYDVKLRIRGVVEPTNIQGGTRTDMGTISYKNMTWRKVPFTVGGTVKQADYEQWRIRVASPQQDYFLNDYQNVGHYVFSLDYEVTIPIAGGSRVTLDCNDSNEREIVNFEKYAPTGVPGSMNFGQFVQISVVSATPR